MSSAYSGSPLWNFTARASADPVKRDLELTCDECGAILCDIEDGDSIGVLADMADRHEHAPAGNDNPKD